VSELAALGVAAEAIDGILAALALRSVEELEGLLGAEDAAVADLRTLFGLAGAYGYADWLVFDASVVRGLAYYTGEPGGGGGTAQGTAWVGGG
jgi:histidyl-tRNA synthetase